MAPGMIWMVTVNIMGAAGTATTAMMLITNGKYDDSDCDEGDIRPRGMTARYTLIKIALTTIIAMRTATASDNN